MYKQFPKDSFLSKTYKTIDNGLKIYGTARGLYEAGTAIATGIRSAYQIASPMLALL